MEKMIIRQDEEGGRECLLASLGEIKSHDPIVRLEESSIHRKICRRT